MIGDVFNLPDDSKYTTIFNSPGSTNDWKTWIKPIGVSYVYIMAISGGGGGGGGFSAASGSARGGGGGGASSAITKVLFSASVIPDRLYIQVGLGGAGSTGSGVNGSVGTRSYVSVFPNTTAANLFLISAGTDPPGGNAGTGSAGGAAVSGATVPATTLHILSALGTLVSAAGNNGAAGGAQTGAAGTSVTAFAVSVLTGGAGGAGVGTADTNFAGGDITGAGIINTIPGGLAAGGAGNPGITLYKPFFTSTGGSGGGSNGASGTGGTGGNGGIGSAGGGGGAGVTGGAGGKGGDGLILIVCY